MAGPGGPGTLEAEDEGPGGTILRVESPDFGPGGPGGPGGPPPSGPPSGPPPPHPHHPGKRTSTFITAGSLKFNGNLSGLFIIYAMSGFGKFSTGATFTSVRALT